MRTPFLCSLFVLSAAVAAQGKEPKAAAVDFEKQVWPILESRCVDCHATEHVTADGKKKKPKGSVVLDSRQGIEAGKKGKPIVVAKKPADSLLYTAITLPAEHEDRMPPEKAKDNTPLPKEQTELIKSWIEQGASFGKWTGKNADAAPKGGTDAKEPPPEKPKEPEKKGG
jgi:uncharacterized membrane protein